MDLMNSRRERALVLLMKGYREVESFVEEYLYCVDFDVTEEGRHKLEDEEEFGDEDTGF